MKNPLYCGLIVQKMGVSAQGDFEPLVSREIFDRVQLVLAGRTPKPVTHMREREEFPLRGLILCPECHKPVTASKSRGKGGSRFAYYRCHRAKGHMNVRSEAIEDAFIDLLNRVTPKPERLALIEQIFRNSWKERVAAATAESVALRKELASEQDRKQRALDKLTRGVLRDDDYAGLD